MSVFAGRVPSSRIGFGTWPIGGTLRKGDYGEVDDREGELAVLDAIERGVTNFDTAPSYGRGRAERFLGRVLRGRRHSVTLVSKCGNRWLPAERRWEHSSSYAGIMTSVDESLRRLRTDFLDLLLIHVPDTERGPDEPMRAFETLRRAGKVRATGVSNFTDALMADYLRHGPLDAVELGYGLFDRRLEAGVMPAAKRSGLSVLTFGALAYGLLGGGWRSDTRFPAGDWRAKGTPMGLPLFTPEHLPQNVSVAEGLRVIARTIGASLPQLAIAWALQNPAVDIVLVGIRTRAELAEDLGALDLTLSSDVMAEIEIAMSHALGAGVPTLPATVGVA
jgi:aryl-alcohol dehydrogenase-like predicted oxidoreductase